MEQYPIRFRHMFCTCSSTSAVGAPVLLPMPVPYMTKTQRLTANKGRGQSPQHSVVPAVGNSIDHVHNILTRGSTATLETCYDAPAVAHSLVIESARKQELPTRTCSRTILSYFAK